MNTNSPFFTFKLMSCRASVPLLYTFETFVNWIKESPHKLEKAAALLGDGKQSCQGTEPRPLDRLAKSMQNPPVFRPVCAARPKAGPLI